MPKNTSILDDRVIIGAIAGALALLTRDIYNLLAQAIGLAKFAVWDFSAALFLKDMAAITGFQGVIIGTLADIVTGALFGVAYIFFLKWTDDKHPILKGWGVGLAAWVLLFGLFWRNLPIIPKEIIPGDLLSNLSGFIGHSIFGLALGVYAWFLLKRQKLLVNDNNEPDIEDDDDESSHHGITPPKPPTAP